jgi:drug/metabolite transporter (DMT)-like permease
LRPTKKLRNEVFGSGSNNALKGHASALFCVLLWGTTFVSTKILLEVWPPLTILILRFVIGTVCLFVMWPRLLPKIPLKQEVCFAGAGLTGVMLYYLIENQALVYTTASNVGIFVSTSPFFVILIEKLFNPGLRLKPFFLLGCLLSFIGVAVICWEDMSLEGAEMVGNLMAVGAGAVWGGYVMFMKRLSAMAEYPVVPLTRRIFIWGVLFTLPVAAFTGFDVGQTDKIDAAVIANLLFLAIGASALCFVAWNKAVDLLGPLITSTYVYLIPAITVVTAAIVLGEPVTLQLVAGLALILFGLYLANKEGAENK